MATSTSTPAASRSLVAHACSWLAICSALLVIAWLTPDPLFFGGRSPVPLRANPLLLSLGIIIAPLGLLLVYLADRYTNFGNFALGNIALFTVVASVALIMASLYPGSGSLLVRDLVQQPELRTKPSVFAFPVFFQNTKAVLTQDEEERLKTAFSVFRSCEAGSIRVRGFASSAEFPVNSDALNLKLANDRAKRVGAILENLVGTSVAAFEWDSFESMLNNRRIRDTALDGTLISQRQGYNRRVEIFWSDSMCIDLPASMLAPSADPAATAPVPTPR